MLDIARLGLSVDSRQVRSATDDVRRLADESGNAERKAHTMGVAYGNALGEIILGVGRRAIQGITAIVKATAEQERVIAQLDTRIKSTGSAAGLARDELVKMASGLQAVTTFGDETIMSSQALLLTFTRIGHEVFPAATEAALNMSIAMGQDLQSATLQLGKALNDPIKGLTALSRAGVQFTTAQKKVIEEMVKSGNVVGAQRVILAELETQMGGAARAARNTLGGAFAALKNAARDLLEGDTSGSGIKGLVGTMNNMIDAMNDPKMKAGFANTISDMFEMANAAMKAARWVSELVTAQMKLHGLTSDVGGGTRRGTFGDTMGGLTKGIGAIMRGDWKTARHASDRAYAGSFPEWGGRIADFSAVSNQEKFNWITPDSGGVAEADKLKKPSMYDPDAGDGKGAGKGASDKAAKAAERLQQQRQRDFENLKDSLRNEEQVISDSYAERTRIIESMTKEGSDERTRLSGLSTALYKEEMEELRALQSREVDDLAESMRTQEEVVRDSYERRMQIIEENVTLEGDAKERLRERVREAYREDVKAIEQAEEQKREALWQGLMTEEEMMIAYHQRKREEILTSTAVTEKMRQELLRREEERFMQESAARERQRLQLITQSAGDMFGALSQLVATYAQGSDRQQKKMFKIAQAFSIAAATISIATGISKAQELPYPQNIFEAIRVAAVGAVQIATIKGQQYAGAYDQGGQIPAGKWGWVGEQGPERVRGPVTVQGRKVSERYADGGSGQVSVEVNVNLMNGDTSTTSQRAAGAGAQDEQQARQLGYLVSSKVQEELVVQQRPGGLLYNMAQGR